MPFWNATSTTLDTKEMYVNNTYKDASGKNKLTTITEANKTGYVPIDANSSDPLVKKLSYAVQTNGKISYLYEDGTGNKVQYNSIQQIADGQLQGYNAQTTEKIKDSMQRNLKTGVESYNKANPTSKINGNQATTQPASGDGNGDGAPPTLKPEQAAALEGENKEYRANTRAGEGAYGDNLIYPLNLKAELQDTVRFSILEYSPSLAKENQQNSGTTQFGSTKARVVTLQSSGIPVVKGSKRLGTITLPIPAGISDGNSVSWSPDDMTMVGMELSNAVQGFFGEGVAGAEKSASNTGEKLTAAAQSGEAQAAIKSLFGKMLSGGNIAGRVFGAAPNNNLELLFGGPGLRTFGFTFSFYPRSAPEAVRVRKIIRAFKQSMAVKRSKTSLLLKTPHTFAISYFTSVDGQLVQHPYLNSFKECALTSCSVDYTPDGTYMTYGDKEKSMTAYRLTLQFQELEPIFDDEYYEIDQNKDTNIGF